MNSIMTWPDTYDYQDQWLGKNVNTESQVQNTLEAQVQQKKHIRKHKHSWANLWPFQLQFLLGKNPPRHKKPDSSA